MGGFGYFIEVLLHPHPSFFLNPFTVVGYAFVIFFLFLPCWLLTRKLRVVVRTLIRATFGAVIFAPGLLLDPAVTFLAYIPGLLASLYYLGEGEAELLVDLALVPMLATGVVIWVIIGAVHLLVFLSPYLFSVR